MSWVFGFIGTSLSPTLRERLVALHDKPLHRAEDTGLYVRGGGLPETCYGGHLPDEPDGRWLVVGLGIRRHDDRCTFLNAGAWQQRLSQPSPDFASLDGHFVALRWRPGRLEAFTDQLGTRTLYLAALPEGVAFSTRLDWLTALRGHAEIDFAAFGAHWLTFNQLSTTGLVRGIQRLGPGGHALWRAGRLKIAERPWMPEIDEQDQDGASFARTLSALVRPKNGSGVMVTLGLSGGLDSRLLLALRMRQLGRAPAFTHVFGSGHHPDVRVAWRIAEGEQCIQYRFHQPVPDADGCLALLRNQVAQTQAVSAASSVMGLRYYGALHEKGLIMLDGGLGEAARRQFMNRFLRRGRPALHSGDPAAILPYLRVPRANIFNADTRAAMEQGAQQQIAALWAALPAPETIGEENFVDVLGVRTRLPNFFGFEQNRLDGIIQNYMPFAQPSLLQTVFHTPLSLRRNGRLFRQLIRARRASLARYPLVKGSLSYPFRLPTLPAYAWTTAKKYLGRGYTDPTRLRFLETLKPFARDAVHSQNVRLYSAYDAARLTRLVEGFYNGKTNLATAVDWWLAFEMWRRVLSVRAF